MKIPFINRIIIIEVVLILNAINVYPQKLSDLPKQLVHGYDFDGNGKDINGTKQDDLYQYWSEQYGFIEAIKSSEAEVIRILLIQKAYLASKKRHIHLVIFPSMTVPYSGLLMN